MEFELSDVMDDLDEIIEHLKEKEANKDYNLNDILNEFNQVMEKCQNDNDISWARTYLSLMRDVGNIGNMAAEICNKKITEREIAIKENYDIQSQMQEGQEINITHEKQTEQKKEEIGALEDKPTYKVYKKEEIDVSEKISKLYRTENGNVGLYYPYSEPSQAARNGSNGKLNSSIASFQFTLGLEEAKGTYKSRENLITSFSKYIDEVLIQCSNEEDIKVLQDFLYEMSRLGIVGKMVYEEFYNQISLENIPLAKERMIERNKEKEFDEQKEDKHPRFDEKVDNTLQEFDEVLSNSRGIDLDDLKQIYERGKTILAESQLKGYPITSKLKMLQERNRQAERTINMLDDTQDTIDSI